MENCRERVLVSIWGTGTGMLLVYYRWLPQGSPLPLGVTFSDLVFFLVAAMLAVATWFSLQGFRDFRQMRRSERLSAIALPLASLMPLWSVIFFVPEAGVVSDYDLTLLVIAVVAMIPALPQWALCRLFRSPESRAARWTCLATVFLVACLGFLVSPLLRGREPSYQFAFAFSLILAGALPWGKSLPGGKWGRATLVALLQTELLWGAKAAHLPPVLTGGILVVSFVLLGAGLSGGTPRRTAEGWLS